MSAISEVDCFAVAGPPRGSSAALRISDKPYVPATWAHDVNLIRRFAVGGEGNPFTIRRPGRPTVESRIVGDVA